jgi:uncharacterized lipoprotein
MKQAGAPWQLVWHAVLLMLLSGGVSGCFWRKDEAQAPRCEDIEEYRSSKSLPPLQVPEGLKQPGATQVMVIPEGETTGGAYPLVRCLEMPPDFFRTAPDKAPPPAN